MPFRRKTKIKKPTQLRSVISESFDGYLHGYIYLHDPNTHTDHVIFDGYGYASAFPRTDYVKPAPIILSSEALRALMSVILDEYRKEVRV